MLCHIGVEHYHPLNNVIGQPSIPPYYIILLHFCWVSNFPLHFLGVSDFAITFLGGGGRRGPVWQLLAKNAIFGKCLDLLVTPFKKMRLDESFRMVQSACHLVAYIKSYGQITVWENVMGKWGRNVMDYILGGIHWTPSKAVVMEFLPPC